MNDHHRERIERRTLAEAKLSSLNPRTRGLLRDETLVNLLDAGWTEERVWDAVELHKFERRHATFYPKHVHEVLLKFGGLAIGINGRSLRVGSVIEYEYVFPDLLNQVVNTQLFVIGETDILCDDALGVMMDQSGHIYVDGSTSDAPPKDYCVGKVASDFTSFLDALFTDEDSVLDETVWTYYSAPQDLQET